MKVVWTLLVCGLGLGWGSGCGGNECHEGEARCEGNVALVCGFAWSDSSAPLIFRRDVCGSRVCVETTVSATRREALCALAMTPDARCPASEWPPAVCADGQLVACSYGYATSSQDCGSPARCVGEPTYSFCALSDAADPRCPTEDFADVCDGDLLLRCRFRRIEQQQHCGAFEACVASTEPRGTLGNVSYYATCQRL